MHPKAPLAVILLMLAGLSSAAAPRPMLRGLQRTEVQAYADTRNARSAASGHSMPDNIEPSHYSYLKPSVGVNTGPAPDAMGNAQGLANMGPGAIELGIRASP